MTPIRKVHALVEAVATGDRQAFEELYRLTSPKLYGIVLRLMRRPELAAEALRRTYGRIHAEAHTLKPQEDPVAWMVSIARACALDMAWRRPVGDAFEPFDVGQRGEDPLAGARRSPALQRLLTCLGTLPEERRRMVLLAFYDGWSREALSVYFDAPPAGIRAWMARSVAQLGACLGRRA
ncbi:RNA polymerase subunit sigma-70 [Xanthobacter dioxanivorans]|uniref:RNA polymerase subunit sigma-70 n=1 Tax=Xanthobacter dioxanivorans TaxID=2528964 RepID=A0A974SH19_9HYPH|nr:sigma factor-like helix-turn-helix DNA-binding protein [Xanthobacter dioxanivorans]QRG04927.1 RNA polymerase subunit sigma-70 [Xanthobacter dioxanivorans]